VISPDGTKLAYKAMKRPGYEADRFQLKVMDLATGTTDVASNLGPQRQQPCVEPRWQEPARDRG
jgi:hypothetical protein